MQSEKLSPREFDIDDYIGMESCVDLKDDDHTAPDMLPPANFSSERKNIGADDKRDKIMWGMGRKEREYPPPIPLLVRTENLPSHMPWVLKRHYTADGRLILTEEKVRHHEYFRAHRSDGRLMLQLVALDDHFSDESNVEVGNGGTESNQDQEDGDDCMGKEGRGDENEGGGGSEGMKCFKYGNVRGRDPAFMFGVAVAGSLRTVES